MFYSGNDQKATEANSLAEYFDITLSKDSYNLFETEVSFEIGGQYYSPMTVKVDSTKLVQLNTKPKTKVFDVPIFWESMNTTSLKF